MYVIRSCVDELCLRVVWLAFFVPNTMWVFRLDDTITYAKLSLMRYVVINIYI